eukprot:9296819-Pyramimonas_sp.AAC.2
MEAEGDVSFSSLVKAQRATPQNNNERKRKERNRTEALAIRCVHCRNARRHIDSRRASHWEALAIRCVH